MAEKSGFFQFYFEFCFEGLCPEWVKQFEAFSEIMLQNVIAGVVEVKNLAVQQHFPGRHEIWQMYDSLLFPNLFPSISLSVFDLNILLFRKRTAYLTLLLMGDTRVIFLTCLS